MALVFGWDPRKAATNVRKHGIEFSEAATIFRLLLTIRDSKNSGEEKRLFSVGQSYRNRLIVVAHTENDNRIRIISARKATGRETRQYEEGQEF